MPATPRSPDTPFVERRNVHAREALVQRIRAEFEGMPGLSVTLAQAASLFGISSDASRRIFAQLILEEMLLQRKDGRYILRS